jgi:hypothetical protein
MIRDGMSCEVSGLTTWKKGTYFNWGSDRRRDLMEKKVNVMCWDFHTGKSVVENPYWSTRVYDK